MYFETDRGVTFSFQVDSDKFSVEENEKISADDKRKSAANIGYVGVGVLAVAFSFIIALDVTSLVRDFRILAANLAFGYRRLSEFFCRRQ